MLSPRLLIVSALSYLLLLFGIALYAERRAGQGRSIIDNPWAYSLSLAVYCTAWTYFGSVGRAAATGIGFLPVYLGPTLGMTLSWLVLLKMIRIAKTQRITSIADLISSRYGKSHAVGGLVSVIALVGTLPYIALQLKAVSSGYQLLTGAYGTNFRLAPPGGSWLADSTLYMALLLAAFTIFFGTRHMDATERHEGMVAAIAFESLVKLFAFLALGAFVCYGLFDGYQDVFQRAAARIDLQALLAPPTGGHAGWFALLILSMLSLLLLPRQFQVSVVENIREEHLRRASWLFPAYLLAINVFVLPIALAGLLYFGPGEADPDTFVLTLPLAAEHPWLALLAFIGGLSAATGMVVVETIAISTMVCNDLVVPLLLRAGRLRTRPGEDLSGFLLGIRRGLILLVLLLGYLYFRIAGEAYALVSIGLVSFAAVAQFAPALLGGMYWRGGRHAGALAGLGAGFAIWLYTLVAPALARSGWIDATFLTAGPWQLPWLRPEHLFGLSGMDSITHALFWSLLANAGLYVLISLKRPPDPREAAQARLFVDVFRLDQGRAPSFWRGNAGVEELRALLARFLGRPRAEALFAAYAQRQGIAAEHLQKADPALVQYAESQLAGVIGSASARAMVASVVKEEPLGIDDVLEILDEASAVRAYSHRLEEKSRELEAASAKLRAANERLQELDRLKDDFMSSVSHELRTPLTSIRAFSELLRDTPDIDPDERARFLDIIVSESERLTRLVNQVLDLAKIESGHAEWHTSEVHLEDVAEQACAATSQLFRDKGADVELALPTHPLPPVRADRDRLVQVLINLLSNAVKIVPAGRGAVKIALEQEPQLGKVGVSVCDNGPGIPPGQLETIFERFRQGEGADKPPGTGLGLHISRQIVEHFGGRLWADNPPAGGACFRLELPRDGASAPLPKQQPPPPP